MDSEAAAASETAAANETYEELYVSPTCHVQTAEDRFGAGVLADLNSFVHSTPNSSYIDFDDDEDEEDEEDEEIEGVIQWMELQEADAASGVGLDAEQNHAQHGFPRTASARNNLTALSQRYNFYFAAYQDRIYVYQPRRTGPHILPPPSLILHPRQSKLGEKMDGAAMDFRFSHQINHITVGNLGDLEIVLFAYDDGDIAAYYTHAVARCIKLNSDQGRDLGPCPGRQGKHPKLFFHENVLKSAWGIAIHEQSRLIAVSTNFHEVTVFAFALSHIDAVIKFPEVDESPKLRCGLTALELQKHFRSRTRTWRIVLPLGRSAGNIPNIAFVDDETGEAEKVVAIDLSGTAWFLDIWGIGPSTIRWADPLFRDHQMMHSIRGWGVLVLPYSSFKPTKTVHEALGVPGNQVIAITKPDEANRVWLDTTCSLYYIKGFSSNPDNLFRHRPPRLDYAKVHATKPECQEDDLSDVWESESDSEDEGVHTATASGTVGSSVTYPPSASLGSEQWSPLTPYKGKAAPSFGDISDEIQLGRCIVPSAGETPRLGSDFADYVRFGRTYAERQAKTKPVDYSKSDFSAHLIKNFCLLRTSMTSIELQPFDRDAPCIECKYPLAHDQRTGPDTPWDLHPTYSERVSMLQHVPELNLVVAGSPTGRVALLTLTKTAKRLHLTRVRHGFRIDCVLPRKAEVAQRLRPGCPLIGVAMSPVPSQPGKRLELGPERGEGAAAAPAVYRLMLHYKNHTILMYDVARGGGEDDELLIF